MPGQISGYFSKSRSSAVRARWASGGGHRVRARLCVQSARVCADTPDMPGNRPRPILSALAEDPALQDGIDEFVLELAGRIDDLQDCELRADLAGLAELAEELLRRSARSGYDGLSRCASVVRFAAREGSTEEARKALVELTEMAHRVRLGHRGSV